MKTLREGKISNIELAEWFGVKVNTFNHDKDKYLKELLGFALYHFEGKTVIIDEIINPIYSKKASATYNKVINRIDDIWDASGLDTCSHVSAKIFQEFFEAEGDAFTLAPSTINKYTRKGRNELYGVPFEGGGSLGSCIYTWCKKHGDGSLSLLTEEEQKIKEQLQIKYFGDTTEKQIFVKGMIEAGEIKKEDAWTLLEELTGMDNGNFLSFLQELQARIGCKIIKGTLVERDQPRISAFDNLNP